MNNTVSISEANANFSKVARMTDDGSEIIVLKNNKPVYAIRSLESELKSDMAFAESADKVINRHYDLLKRLAK